MRGQETDINSSWVSQAGDYHNLCTGGIFIKD